MRRSLAALWLIALVSTAAADEFEVPTLRGTTPYVPAPPVYSYWSGFYAGGQLGASAARMSFGNAPTTLVQKILRFTKLEDQFHPEQWPSLPSASDSAAGFGGFVGYNSQWDDVVLGVEANYTHVSAYGIGSDSVSRIVTIDDYNYFVTVTSSASMHLTNMGTARVRAGYVMGQALPYITAGVALGTISYTKSASVSYPTPIYALAPPTPPDQPPPVPPPFAQSLNETHNNALAVGYSAGAGVDFMLLPNVFLRAEYEYVSFPMAHMTMSLHTGRVGAGLRF